MPNWVVNNINFIGEKEDIAKVIERITTIGLEEELDLTREDYDSAIVESIDFNKIIPMPSSLNLECGSMTDRAIITYLTKKGTISPEEFNKKALEKFDKMFFFGTIESKYKSMVDNGTDLTDNETYILGEKYVNNFLKYGSTTWYDWACAHWGTKWNACDSFIDKDNDTITFETAWSCPAPILKELALICKMYNVAFQGEYCDENYYGDNKGSFFAKNGEIDFGFPTTPEEELAIIEKTWGELDGEFLEEFLEYKKNN